MRESITGWKRVSRFVAGLACLTSLLGPFLGLLLYPRAKWLFALMLIGVGILYLDSRLAKDPTPDALAEQMERLLTANYTGWDVDDFEMQTIRDPTLKDLHRRSMSVGLPEEWPRLDEERKSKLWQIIAELRSLGPTQGTRTS